MRQPEDFLVENLPLIERIVASVCRRYHMAPEETEEFSSELKLRLIENNYAILRRFEGRSAFGTYIAAVVVRVLRDYRTHQFGKWNTSAAAKRIGAAAVELERLLYRDHRSLDEAFVELKTKLPSASRSDLEELAAKLPARWPRRQINIDDVELAQDPDVLHFEHTDEAMRLSAVVRNFLDSLPKEDQLIFRLRFESSMTVSEIARSLHLVQKPLYRRLDRLYKDLRATLETVGIGAEDATALVGSGTAFLDFNLRRGSRPTEARDQSKMLALKQDKS